MNIFQHLVNLDSFNNRVVKHDQFNMFVEKAELMINQSSIYKNPPAIGILGESGCGKTWIAEELLRRYPDHMVEVDNGAQCIAPVILVKVPPTRSLRDLIRGMLDQLHTAYKKGDSAETLTKALKNALTLCKTKLIFIDEIQQITDGKGASLSNVRNWIKIFFDNAKVSVIFMGLESGRRVLSGEELARRVRPILSIKPFTYPSSNDHALVKTYIALEKSLMEDCNISLRAAGTPLDISRRLWIAGAGRIGQIRSIIHDAAFAALSKGEPGITIETLQKAYHESPPDTTFLRNGNPFSLSREAIEIEARKHKIS